MRLPKNGCFSADGYTHDAQCVSYAGPDSDYRDREVCFAFNEDTLTIVDVTNKAAPRSISRTSYPGVGYTHQGWASDDHMFLLLGDEADEQDFVHNTITRVWDLSVPQQAAREMGVGPPESPCRRRFQTTVSGCGQKPWS